jgi:uncharacterized OsmC-like protein
MNPGEKLMNVIHNVRVDNARQTALRAKTEPSAAQLKVDLGGEWRTDEARAQFGATVKYLKGETVLESDFPPSLTGDGRAPSPLIYCFYGALSCYASTFAMQAAMAGIVLTSLRARLRLTVDFRGALGVEDVVPLDKFVFELDVETLSSDDQVQRVKQVAEDRCPAIWAMNNRVPYEIAVRCRS